MGSLPQVHLGPVQGPQVVPEAQPISHISTLIDRHIAPSLDRKTAAIYRGSKDLYDDPLEFWSRILSAIRPERPELLPSVAQYNHSALVDLRPVKAAGDVETALKAKPRDQAQDDLLFKILEKPFAQADPSSARLLEHA